MAGPTSKERAWRIYSDPFKLYPTHEEKLERIDDMINYVINDEENNKYKERQLRYWQKVRDEYIKITTNLSTSPPTNLSTDK